MRNFLAGLGGGTGAFAAAAVCAAVVVAGYWVQTQRNQQAEPAQLVALPGAEPKPAPPQPATEDKVEAPQASPQAPSADTAASPPPPAPAFDEVRREADGMTVIAGRGAPGAAVMILQNGVEIARSVADGSGRFATLAMIPPDGQGHVLTLLQDLDGAQSASDAEIILAPMAPVAVAQTDQPAAPAAPDGTGEEAAQTTVATPQEDEPATAAPDADPPKAEVQTADVPPNNPAAPAAAPQEPDTDPTTEQQVVASATIPQDANEAPVQQAPATSEPEPAPAPQVAAAPTTEPAAQPDADPASQKPAQVAVLKSTAQGVELLNTPRPEAMTNVAIDTISYSDEGEVELAGRAQTRASSVRVYLDNRSIVSLPVDTQGRWRGELPQVDEGIYTLRVDEVAADGAVTSRVETPFKREDAQVLAAAAATQDGPLKAITVQKGATLWAIARERYGDGQLYVRVFEANAAAIRDPDLIYPGQIFDLPD